MPPEREEQTITVSLRWIALFAFLVLAGGMVGGFIASYFFAPATSLPPFSATPLPAIERITVTESQLVTDQVAAARESVVLLSSQSTPSIVVGAGIVLTNDGLIATTAAQAGEDITARDAAGRTVRTQYVGRDALFGITYYRLLNSVVVPLPTRDEDPDVGTRLTVIASDQETTSAITQQTLAHTYTLPGPSAPSGIQRYLKTEPLEPTLVPGSPALDDTGMTSGIVVDSTQGLLLPIRHVLASFNRVTTEQRELNPFADLGFSLSPDFIQQDESTVFAPSVTSVAQGRPAREAGLRPGDAVLRINNREVSWEHPLASLLTGEEITVLVLRSGEEREFQIQRNTR